MRVNYEDFKMNTDKVSTPEASVYHDYNGNIVSEKERENCCCYKDANGAFVKVNVQKTLYDERDEAYISMSGKAAKATISKTFSFIKVPGRVWSMYLQYLKTKNQGYLRQAQREIDQGSGHVKAAVIQASADTSSVNDTSMNKA